MQVPQASFGQGQQQRIQIHPYAQGVSWAEVPVNTDDADQRRAEELRVARNSGRMLRRILTGDSHCPIDLSAQLAAIVLERPGSGGILGGPRRAVLSRTATRRSRGGPDANTICHGWMLEDDGARRASARHSSITACGTAWGKNIRVE